VKQIADEVDGDSDITYGQRKIQKNWNIPLDNETATKTRRSKNKPGK